MQFFKEYDVAVIGAGIAGCAAALAAARRGNRVALIEKQTLIGGLATSGLIFVYLPLCDGYGHQVTFGLAEEFLKRSLKYSPYDLPTAWGGAGGRANARGGRCESYFSPAGFILSLDEMLAEAHVDLWLETLAGRVKTDRNNKICSIEVENISGPGVIQAKCFVDASGTAHIVRQAGGKILEDENRLSVWFIQNSPSQENQNYNLIDSLHIKTLHRQMSWLERGGALRGRNVTDFTREGWKMIRDYYDKSYLAGNSKYQHFPVQLPSMSEFRKIAAAAGREKLADQDYAKFRASSIGLAGDWRKPGPVWETPFGSLVPENTGGVFTAGRCIGAAGLAWEIFRVIPAAAMTGEAAGTAAGLCAELEIDSRELPAETLQNELKKKKIPLHIDEIIPSGYTDFKPPAAGDEGINLEDR